jgi:hypothetical protein
MTEKKEKDKFLILYFFLGGGGWVGGVINETFESQRCSGWKTTGIQNAKRH